MSSILQSTDHGPARMTWVYRNQGKVALAVGRLYAMQSGASRSGVLHRLLPFRYLPEGRYDLTFARYGVAWPVTLRRDPDADRYGDRRLMIAEGRVPL
ncbi:MAG: hypothetical protein M0R73_01975 [Dehalococcoidia bacterium]|nr:hypothetical protein [Dehalococcoidia bacterium]